MPTPQKKTPAEIRSWLFNDLMSQIEPDLTEDNRPFTIGMLAQLSPDVLQEQLKWYEDAFKEFVRRWPAYVESIVADLESETKKFTAMISEGEFAEMAEIEKRLSSLNPDA